MVSCVAYGCNNKTCSDKGTRKLSFFKFPGEKEPERRQAWVNAVRREKWTPSNYSFLCSEHFTADQIDLTYVSGPRLKSGSIPNVFAAHPDHLKPKIVVKRKPPAKQLILKKLILSNDESLNKDFKPPIDTIVQEVDKSTLLQKRKPPAKQLILKKLILSDDEGLNKDFKPPIGTNVQEVDKSTLLQKRKPPAKQLILKKLILSNDESLNKDFKPPIGTNVQEVDKSTLLQKSKPPAKQLALKRPILNNDESLNKDFKASIGTNVQEVDKSSLQQMASENVSLQKEIVQLQNELRRKGAMKIKKDRLIRTLRQNNARKEKRINNMTSLINELRKQIRIKVSVNGFLISLTIKKVECNL